MPGVVYEDGNCLYSDETNIHITGHMKTQHCCVWRDEQRHEIYEHVRDSARVNAWCRIMSDHVVGSSFRVENTIKLNICLDMLQFCLSTLI
jgi:hypothetical protein